MEENFFSQIYLDLQARIKEMVPEIKVVEQNLGQYLYDDWRTSVGFPGVLIDFPNTPFSAMAGNNQLGTPVINIVLVFEANSLSYNLAPLAVREKALQYYSIVQKLHKALQGWSPDYCQPLTRINAKSQNRHDKGVRIRELDYSTEFEDWSLDEDRD